MPTNTSSERSAEGRAERGLLDTCCQVPLCPFLLRLLFHVRSVSGGLERWCIRRKRWYVPVRTQRHFARSACTVRCCFAWSWPSDAVRSDPRAWHRRTDALSQSREARAAHSSSVCTDARFGGSSNRLRLRNTLPLAATTAAPQGGPTLYRCGGWRCGSTGCCAAQRLPLIVCRSSIGLFWAGIRDGRRHRSYDGCRSGTRCTAPEAGRRPFTATAQQSWAHQEESFKRRAWECRPAPIRSPYGPGRVQISSRWRASLGCGRTGAHRGLPPVPSTTSGVALRVDAGHLLDPGPNRGGPNTRPVPYWSADKTIKGPRQELAGGLGWV